MINIKHDTNFIFRTVTIFEFVYVLICITNIEKVCSQNLSGYLWTVGFVAFIHYCTWRYFIIYIK